MTGSPNFRWKSERLPVYLQPVKLPAFRVASALALMPISCAQPSLKGTASHIDYACDDAVVVGRLQNLSMSPIEDPNDLIGHGFMTANVHIEDVLKGHVTSRRVPAKYYGHTYMRDDRDFLFVLMPVDQGSYFIRAAWLIEMPRPPLASRCKPLAKRRSA